MDSIIFYLRNECTQIFLCIKIKKIKKFCQTKKKKPLNKLKFCKAILGHEEEYTTKVIYKNLQEIKYHN